MFSLAVSKDLLKSTSFSKAVILLDCSLTFFSFYSVQFHATTFLHIKQLCCSLILTSVTIIYWLVTFSSSERPIIKTTSMTAQNAINVCFHTNNPLFQGHTCPTWRPVLPYNQIYTLQILLQLLSINVLYMCQTSWASFFGQTIQKIHPCLWPSKTFNNKGLFI